MNGWKGNEKAQINEGAKVHDVFLKQWGPKFFYYSLPMKGFQECGLDANDTPDLSHFFLQFGLISSC